MKLRIVHPAELVIVLLDKHVFHQKSSDSFRNSQDLVEVFVQQRTL